MQTDSSTAFVMDEREGYTLLDVHIQQEFEEGHIEGAIVIPDSSLFYKWT